MIVKKKHIIAGVIAVGSITAALAYLQYKKLMNYCIGFKSVKIKSLSEKFVDFDVFMNLKNMSDIKIEIVSQEYNVYLNDKFVTKASNSALQVIEPSTVEKPLAIVGVNIQFNPTEVYGILKLNLRDLLVNRDKIKIKVDMKLKVKMWFFTVNIPYVYETNLKELMTPSPVAPNAPKDAVKCK